MARIEEYPEEVKRLAGTVEFIDNEITRLKGLGPARAAHTQAASAIQKANEQKLATYKRARAKPYFGRIDFLKDGGDVPIEAYIGTDHIQDQVFSWTAPFPGQLFYADPQKVVSYAAPKGSIRGRITRKRQYAIENTKLLEVNEVFALPSPKDGQLAAKDTTRDYLSEQLSQSRGGGMHEVIATIQPEQYERIASTPSRVMIVQGVAGSGKSIIGLHRIAFLLSPFNGLSQRISSPSRVIFFGPTRNFLKYVAGLLPSLNVRSVPQLTVRDWLLGTLSARVIVNRGEPLLEKLLRHSGPAWDARSNAAKLKGSLRMARAMERYVATIRRRFESSAADIAIRVDGGSRLVIDRNRVRQVLRSLREGPLNSQRASAIEGVIDAAWLDAKSSWWKLASGRRPIVDRREFGEHARPQVELQTSAFWPILDFRAVYRRFLIDTPGLIAASDGRINAQEAAALAASIPQGVLVFEAEDLGGLAQLDHLLNERVTSRFEHVVIDEAQEVSPIELRVILEHGRGAGFTILGDLTQSLSPQGIDQWREVLPLFRESKVERYLARTSFRATREITKYANRLLKETAPNGLTAIPYRSAGTPVRFVRSPSYAEMVNSIAADLKRFKEAGARTIAVLTKSATDARKLYRALRAGGLEHISLTDEDAAQPSASVSVAPIYLTRGLEFDAVIIAGAGEDNYPSSPLHGTLLYLGVTRAAHQLHIYWLGRPAAALGLSGPKPSGP